MSWPFLLSQFVLETINMRVKARLIVKRLLLLLVMLVLKAYNVTVLILGGKEFKLEEL